MADHPLSKPSLPKKESKIKPPSKNGDVIFGALVKLAALITLLLLGGIIVSLFIASLPSIQKFGFSFLWSKEWDAPAEQFGALVPIYGTIVTSIIGSSDCGSCEFWYRPVSDGVGS